ncbi:MAG: hypothetical protein ACJ71Q_09065 [Terriglobales bacterium]
MKGNLIQDRFLTNHDLPILADSLSTDQYHKETSVSFFTAPGTVCKVYEDEAGPICFVRGSKALRLDVQFMDNTNIKRNGPAILALLADISAKARQNGYTELIFNTDNPALARFCKKRFGFVESEGELRRLL